MDREARQGLRERAGQGQSGRGGVKMDREARQGLRERASQGQSGRGGVKMDRGKAGAQGAGRPGIYSSLAGGVGSWAFTQRGLGSSWRV